MKTVTTLFLLLTLGLAGFGQGISSIYPLFETSGIPYKVPTDYYLTDSYAEYTEDDIPYKKLDEKAVSILYGEDFEEQTEYYAVKRVQINPQTDVFVIYEHAISTMNGEFVNSYHLISAVGGKPVDHFYRANFKESDYTGNYHDYFTTAEQVSKIVEQEDYDGNSEILVISVQSHSAFTNEQYSYEREVKETTYAKIDVAGKFQYVTHKFEVR